MLIFCVDIIIYKSRFLNNYLSRCYKISQNCRSAQKNTYFILFNIRFNKFNKVWQVRFFLKCKIYLLKIAYFQLKYHFFFATAFIKIFKTRYVF